MIYNIIVDISTSQIDKPFYYKSSQKLNLGDRVLVPFGAREIEGFVLGVEHAIPTVNYEIKEIIKKLDDYQVVLPELIELAKFMRKSNLRYIDCFRLFMPPGVRKGTSTAKKVNYLIFNPNHTLDSALAFLSSRSKAQHELAKRMFEKKEALMSEMTKEFSASTVATLIEKNIIYKELRIEDRLTKGLDKEDKNITLTPEQSAVVDAILNSNESKFLIHGVTGSGKTEVYMNLIDHYLSQGKTAIILVPEISLTPQMLGVFRARFGDKVGVLHSKLNQGERHDEWQRIRRGESTVVLGPRSAIFAPIENVGIIIIDEEHDPSYISESNPRYFTSDIAEFRAKYNCAKLVLGSATPSVETYKRAEEDKEFVLLELKNRINKQELPDIEIVDMGQERREGNKSIISKKLASAMEKTLNEKKQIILFLNRRGYSSYVNCQSCGYIAQCPNCDVSLTYHRYPESLTCHYCGAQYKMIKKCPSCNSMELKEGRVGTEQVADLISKIFPNARILRLDNDTTKKKNSYNSILSKFAKHDADILIGTQMVVKGHDFPNVTLVGILDADISLFIPNYKAREKTFQLVTQVAGRAGREKNPGKVYLQTFAPNHPLYKVACRYDYTQFYQKEKAVRKHSHFPPYTRMIKILCTSIHEYRAVSASRQIYEEVFKILDSKEGVIRVKHMQASMKKLNNKYQYQVMVFILKDHADMYMQSIYDIVNNINEKDVLVFVEINSQQDI